MEEKQKKVRKYSVGKASSRKMRIETLDTISGLSDFAIISKQKECHNGQLKIISRIFTT